MAILECKKVTRNFGGLVAVSNIDLQVEQGEIVGLIGPNGAGKTTLFNLIGGSIHPTDGRILFRGEDVTTHQPHEICKLGVARTFQLVKPFAHLTVLQNVMVGAFNRTSSPAEATER